MGFKWGIKKTDFRLLIIDLINLMFHKYFIKILRHNTRNFDVHFCNGKKYESHALLH